MPAVIAGPSKAVDCMQPPKIIEHSNKLINLLKDSSSLNPIVNHEPPRPGDVRDSLANISSISKALGFKPTVNIEDGILEYMNWAKTQV